MPPDYIVNSSVKSFRGSFAEIQAYLDAGEFAPELVFALAFDPKSGQAVVHAFSQRECDVNPFLRIDPRCFLSPDLCFLQFAARFGEDMCVLRGPVLPQNEKERKHLADFFRFAGKLLLKNGQSRPAILMSDRSPSAASYFFID